MTGLDIVVPAVLAGLGFVLPAVLAGLGFVVLGLPSGSEERAA